MRTLIFNPIYQERVWGGRNLAAKLGRELPADKNIGESWEIVDRPEAMSRTSDNRSIRELIERFPEAIMGPGWPAGRPFPILVKWLDCQEKLSLQVHPPAEIAAELGGDPKTENWYIADAEPGATLMAGLKKGTTREAFEAGLKNDQLEPLVHTFAVSKGESIFIPSGRLHAIGGGNLILEIQQNSDTTYRVYDWGRVGLDGQPRQLHIEESLASTDFGDFEPETRKTGAQSQVLAESDVFDLKKICLGEGETIRFPSGQPRIISLIHGQLISSQGERIEKSVNALLPASENFELKTIGPCEFLLTENFNRLPEE